MLRDRLVERLAWIGALVSLATAAILLLGPLWDSAVGENPLERDPDLDITAVLRLALPTVIVMAAVAVALSAGRRRVAGALALLVMGVAVWQAPSPLPVWFLPGLVVTAVGYAVSLRRRGSRSGEERIRQERRVSREERVHEAGGSGQRPAGTS